MSGDLIYGKHAVAGLLDGDPSGVLEMWVLDDARDAHSRALARSAETYGVALHRVPRRTFDRLLPGVRHQGIAARYRPVATRAPDLDAVIAAAGDDTLLLALDGVDDPQNLGACLRSAAAAGASAVLVPRSRAAGLTPAVRKVACGGAEAVPLVRVANLSRALARLGAAGVWRVGAEAGAPRGLYDARLSGPLALVLGGEHEGLRRLTRESCDELVRIPMNGAVESLNVSVAAGVCLFEARRQWNHRGD